MVGYLHHITMLDTAAASQVQSSEARTRLRQTHHSRSTHTPEQGHLLQPRVVPGQGIDAHVVGVHQTHHPQLVQAVDQ